MGKISDELRASVLQAAIQGKLTEQRPEDGDARDLLAEIKKEKERLITEKKIKKEKPLDPIDPDDVPFQIPENWSWVYLGDVFLHNAGKALNAKDTNGTKKKYITTSNVYADHFELDDLREMYYTDDEIEKYSVKKGDMLVLEGGDIGRTAVWNLDDSYCIQNHIHRLRPYTKVDIYYFYRVMSFYKNCGLISGKGIGIQGLSANKLHAIKVPLPPVIEQKRIVTHVEELMTKIDELEKIENELEEIKKTFLGDMKAAILQAAMQGKLTKQKSDKGTATEIIKLIPDSTDKKNKKGSNDSSFEMDKPFEIPNSWQWVRLEHLTMKEIRRGKSPVYDDKGRCFAFAQKCNSKYDGIRLDLAHRISNSSIKKYDLDDMLSDKDIVINSTGNGTLGRIGMYLSSMNPENYDYYPDSHVTLVRVLEVIIPEYAMYCLRYYQPYLEKVGSGSTNQTELKADVVNNILIPLPPLEEQKRIVDILDQVLPLCDTLIEK